MAMGRVVGFAGLVVVTALGSVSCGGSPAAPAPTGSASVVAALPPGHLPALVPGEKVSLAASLTTATGLNSDCSAAAIWESSDPNVAMFSSANQLIAVKGGTFSVSAICNGVKSAALALSVGGGVRIGGVDGYAFLLPAAPRAFYGERVRLTARLVDANGVLGADCARSGVWTTSDPNVARVGRDPSNDYSYSDLNWLAAYEPGSTTVTVSCGSATGQMAVRVQPVRVSGVVRDTNGQPVAGATVELAETASFWTFHGSTAFTALTAADGSYAIDWFWETVCIRASREDTVLNQFPCVTADHALPSLSVNATVATLRNVVIQQASVGVCHFNVVDPRCSHPSNSSSFRTAFTPVADGPLVIRASWPPGDGTGLGVTVSACDSSFERLAAFDAFGGGLAYQLNARSGCTYTLLISLSSGAPAVLPVTYRITQ